MSKLGDLIKNMSAINKIALGYLVTILAGAFLLLMPFSSKAMPPDFIEALFTSASATCVTGLVLFDTYTQWSVIGQIIIISLVQIGGLGFMTMVTLVAIATGQKIGIRDRAALEASGNKKGQDGIVGQVIHIACLTAVIELSGAVLFAIRFIPEMGVAEGIGNAIFLSISAFCNAGFDLFGRFGEFSSMAYFGNDSLIVLTVCALSFIGGIGFMVWDDVVQHKLRFSAYKLHSKLALSMTIGLTILGTVLFFFYEADNTAKGLSMSDRLELAFFNAVMPRSAGFCAVDINELAPASKLLTVVFMLIGGSPGSTAGGLKTVTVAVLMLTAFANMRGSRDVNVFGRRLHEDADKRALTVLGVNISLIISAALAISTVQPEIDLSAVIFEVIAGISTSGISMGITRELNEFSRIIIILLMYCGRVGSVSFAILFTGVKKFTGVQNPEEWVSVG